MKRRLNILCLLVFLVFCYSVFNMGRDFGHGFSEGMKISHSGNQSVEPVSYTHLTLPTT